MSTWRTRNTEYGEISSGKSRIGTVRFRDVWFTRTRDTAGPIRHLDFAQNEVTGRVTYNSSGLSGSWDSIYTCLHALRDRTLTPGAILLFGIDPLQIASELEKELQIDTDRAV